MKTIQTSYFSTPLKFITNILGKNNYRDYMSTKLFSKKEELTPLYFKKYFQITDSEQYNYWFKDFLDFILDYFVLLTYKQKNTNSNINIYFNSKQLKNNMYSNINISNKNYLSGIFSLFNLFSKWFLSIIILVSSIYFLLFLKIIIINKILFNWLVLSIFIYLLISGFVFFCKKYRYGKFTTAIQRFWKRTYIIFWLIESSIFIVFFYLTMNASEEVTYMYDQIKFFKTHFVSWRLFLSKMILVLILILNTYYLIFFLKWNTFYKNSYIILINSLILLYIVWTEFYQLYHISSFYSNINWYYDYDDYMWTLEYEFKKTRLVNNYMSLCLFAKFWHMLFIFGFWVFFILRSNEGNRMRYLFLTCNYQNFLILYILSWLYMYPWFKYILRNFLDSPYYWFLTNTNELSFKVFFNDFLNFYNVYNLYTFNNLNKFNVENFFYLISSSNSFSFLQYKNSILRDLLISNI